jgi:hypothetical protein
MRKNPYTNEMSSIKYCLFLYFLSLLSYNAGAQNEWLQLVSEKRLSEHAFILAADSMAGRGIDPGYRGLDMAAEYLQNQIKEIGLQP